MSKLAIVVSVAVILCVIALLIRRYRQGPCPWWLIVLLENPYTDFFTGSKIIMNRLELAPGMKVLDVGCGPGRISIPAAGYVGPSGEVTALDLQRKMLEILEKRAAENHISNLKLIQGGSGEGKLGLKDYFDRAVLITVLGEIPDKKRALEEIYSALKPGGILSVTELLPDPDYLSKKTVIKLAESAGFKYKEYFGSFISFTLNFKK